MNPIYIYIYVVAWFMISLITYFLYVIDKNKAIKNQRRIKEKTLLLSSFILGSIGGLLGMYLARHKTKHWYFVVINWGSFLLHCGILYLLLSNFIDFFA